MKPMSEWTDAELAEAARNPWGNRMGAVYAKSAKEEIAKRRADRLARAFAGQPLAD
jgi:hypothetical protein